MRAGTKVIPRVALALLFLAVAPGRVSAAAEAPAAEPADKTAVSAAAEPATSPAAEAAEATGSAAEPPVPEEPVILEIGEYPYPYSGKLEVEIDPKGYAELQWGIIERRRSSEAFAVRNLEWAPVSRKLTLDFSPKRFREWVLDIAFRNPEGKGLGTVVSKEFSVALPPWHSDGKQREFTLEALGHRCLHSEINDWLRQVKTIVAFNLRLSGLPESLDRSNFIGYYATAPRLKYRWRDEGRTAEGVGRGMARADKELKFGANYDLELKPYPTCEDLAPTLTLDWSDSKIHLVDKYQFPVESTVGRVVVRQAEAEEAEPAAAEAPADAEPAKAD